MDTREEIKQLKAQLSELAAEMHRLSDAAAKDNGGIFTEDQREKFDKLDAEYDAKQKRLGELEADLARKNKAGDRLRHAGEFARQTSHEGPVEDEPEVPEQLGFDSLGEQMLAIVAAASAPQNGTPIPRHYAERLAATGSSSGVDSDGGFLVQKQFSAELFKRMYEVGQVAGRCRNIPIGDNADGLRMNAIDETSRANGSRFGGIRAYWKAEAAQMTGTNPKFRQIDLELQDLTGLWYATDRLLRDAVALEGVANEAFPEEFAFVVDDSLINGDGAGKPLGILNSNALVTISKETNQKATSLDYKNLVKMWGRCWARSRMNSVWFVNQDVEQELYSLEFPVGTGGVPAFLPPGGLSASPYSTLFGRPVIPIEHCATLGTVGDIILADMSQYLLIQKGGVQSARSMHLRFDYNETAFRWVLRLNGQPLWNNALTPFKGSNTLSPFVALATRS